MSNKGQHELDHIFLEYYDILYRYGIKVCQDDYIVQESIQELFLYFYEKDIDFSNIEFLKSYLIKSFRRRLLKNLKDNYQVETLTNIHFEVEEFLPSNEEQKLDNQKLVKVLNQLPWSQREAVFLKFYNNLSGKEIAEIMNIKPQVVANTIYKTLKKIKGMLDRIPLLMIIMIHCISILF